MVRLLIDILYSSLCGLINVAMIYLSLSLSLSLLLIFKPPFRNSIPM